MSPTLSQDPHKDALRVALIYAGLALLWIVGGDLLARAWISDIQQAMWFETAKGAGFAVATGALLYWWVRGRLLSREEQVRNLSTLTAQVPDLIFRLRLRPKLEFEYVSPAAVDLAGFTPEEHYNDLGGVIDAVHPDDREKLQALLSDPDSIEDSLELRWIHKSGDVVWVEFRVTRQRNDAGHVEVVEGIARDITERRRAEERNAILATAVDAVGEAVFITDTDGRIEYVNPAFTEITGYAPDEAVGHTPRILNSGHQAPEFYEELWSTITSGRTFRGEMVNRRKDGTLYDQEVTITPVSENGRITRYVAVAWDVTLQNEMQRQLLRSYKMDAVGQMAAGISHDFRNLLNVIQVNADLIQSDLPGPVPAGMEKAARRAEEIESAARKGSDLVGKLLTLARKKELDLAVADLGRIVEDGKTSIRALLPESVSLETSLEEGLIASVDEGALQQILLNLTTNAADSMPGGGTLSIGLTSTRGRPPESSQEPGEGGPSYARLRVEDTGMGIEPETLERVFDPFFTTKTEGTGLGLAMVRSLVHQQGGFIHVDSQPGEGTTFDLFFPRREPVRDEPHADEGTDPSGSKLPKGTERILLVEDEAPLRQAAHQALTRLGYSVVTASDGFDALSRIDEDSLDCELVLTDLVMPEMGGMDLYETLQKRGIRVPVLFMSGYGADERGVPTNPNRSRHFLQKPWTIEDLAWKVRDALDPKRSRSDRR